MLSNQSVSVHVSGEVPRPSGLVPLSAMVLRTFLKSSQVLGGVTPSAVNWSGRYHSVLLLLNLTMIAYSTSSTLPMSRTPGA